METTSRQLFSGKGSEAECLHCNPSPGTSGKVLNFPRPPISHLRNGDKNHT